MQCVCTDALCPVCPRGLDGGRREAQEWGGDPASLLFVSSLILLSSAWLNGVWHVSVYVCVCPPSCVLFCSSLMSSLCLSCIHHCHLAPACTKQLRIRDVWNERDSLEPLHSRYSFYLHVTCNKQILREAHIFTPNKYRTMLYVHVILNVSGSFYIM